MSILGLHVSTGNMNAQQRHMWERAEESLHRERQYVPYDQANFTESVSDLDAHPWQRYFLHHAPQGEGWWRQQSSEPRIERDLFKKLGLGLSDPRDLRSRLQRMKADAPFPDDGAEAEEHDMPVARKLFPPHGDSESVSAILTAILGHGQVDWCFYNVFTRDDRQREQWVLSTFSALGSRTAAMLVFVAIFSIWHSSLVFTFQDVLLHDARFGPGSKAYEALEVLDIMLDPLYLIGTMLRLRTTILDPVTLHESTRPNTILMEVLRFPSFWADLFTVAVTPARLAIGLRTPVALALGCTKILRGWRFVQPRNDPVRLKAGLAAVTFRLGGLLLLLGHLVGCIWFMLVHSLADVEAHPFLQETATGGSARFAEVEEPMAVHYSHAWRMGVYIVLGFDWEGMSSYENAFATFALPLGFLLCAILFWKVIVIMQQSSAIQASYSQEFIQVKQALEVLGVPANTCMRIQAYHAFRQLHRSNKLGDEMRAGLSPQLRLETNVVLYYDLVLRSYVFNSLPARPLRELLSALTEQIHLPGDYICRAKDQAVALYFVSKGSCSVFQQDLASIIRELRAGSSFGEVALLLGKPHGVYVRADSYSILAVLDSKPFEQLLRQHPKVAEFFAKQLSPVSTADRSNKQGRKSVVMKTGRLSDARAFRQSATGRSGPRWSTWSQDDGSGPGLSGARPSVRHDVQRASTLARVRMSSVRPFGGAPAAPVLPCMGASNDSRPSYEHPLECRQTEAQPPPAFLGFPAEGAQAMRMGNRSEPSCPRPASVPLEKDDGPGIRGDSSRPRQFSLPAESPTQKGLVPAGCSALLGGGGSSSSGRVIPCSTQGGRQDGSADIGFREHSSSSRPGREAGILEKMPDHRLHGPSLAQCGDSLEPSQSATQVVRNLDVAGDAMPRPCPRRPFESKSFSHFPRPVNPLDNIVGFFSKGWRSKPPTLEELPGVQSSPTDMNMGYMERACMPAEQRRQCSVLPNVQGCQATLAEAEPSVLPIAPTSECCGIKAEPSVLPIAPTSECCGIKVCPAPGIPCEVPAAGASVTNEPNPAASRDSYGVGLSNVCEASSREHAGDVDFASFAALLLASLRGNVAESVKDMKMLLRKVQAASKEMSVMAFEVKQLRRGLLEARHEGMVQTLQDEAHGARWLEFGVGGAGAHGLMEVLRVALSEARALQHVAEHACNEAINERPLQGPGGLLRSAIRRHPDAGDESDGD